MNKLCVKQLAAALGKHPNFVYAMRRAGFIMRWDAELRCEATTAALAAQWIRRTGFRMVRGRGVKRV